MNLIDYREKLGIAFNDEEKVKLFLAKAYLSFSETVSLEIEITSTLYNNYCFKSIEYPQQQCPNNQSNS